MVEKYLTKEGKVILNYKSIKDAPNDYSWQTDAELAYLMATNPLTIGFTDYLSEYANQLRRRNLQKSQFAIKTIDGRHIGNCACYGINSEKSEAEIGIILGNRHYWDKGYGTNAVISLVKYVFNHTNSIRIRLKTLESNKRAQRCFLKCGFTMCGSIMNNGHDFILMELHRSS